MPLRCTQHLIQNSLPAFPLHIKQVQVPVSEKDHVEVSSRNVPRWVILIKAPGTRRKLAQQDQIQAPLNTSGYL